MLGQDLVNQQAQVTLANWKPGSQIVQYEMLGKGIGLARPVRVVEDGPGRIALYSHPGTPMVTRDVDNYRSLALSERIELTMRMLDPGVGEFRGVTTPDSHAAGCLAFGDVVLVFGLAAQEVVRQSPVADSSSA